MKTQPMVGETESPARRLSLPKIKYSQALAFYLITSSGQVVQVKDCNVAEANRNKWRKKRKKESN